MQTARQRGRQPRIPPLRALRQKAKPQRKIHSPKETPTGIMEKAGLQLASYEQRIANFNRRAAFPKNKMEINQRREQIRGMTPKQLREYLGKLNPNEQRVQQTQLRKGVPVTVNTRINQTIRVQKKKGSPVKSASLTNYGKFSKIFTDPAGRAWENMDANHRERMAEYVIKTTNKFLSSTKHVVGEGPARRLRVEEVRGRRLPTIENMAHQLHQKIEYDSHVLREMKKMGNDPVMIEQMERTVSGLKNRATIIEGIIQGLKSGQFDTVAKRAERRHVKKIVKKTLPAQPVRSDSPVAKKQIIPFPGAEALRASEAGISIPFMRAIQKQSPSRPARSAIEETMIRSMRQTLRPYPKAIKALDDFFDGKITEAEARSIINHEQHKHLRGKPRTVRLNEPKNSRTIQNDNKPLNLLPGHENKTEHLRRLVKRGWWPFSRE